MESQVHANSGLRFHPLAPERWPDLEQLFGTRGACGGCWCMAWRLKRADFESQKGAANKRAFQMIIASEKPAGILAYRGREPLGWCAVAPRQDYPRLSGSRILRPVDDQPVWSVTCLFVARGYRRYGLSSKLLCAAVNYACEWGAKIVEGYPIESRTSNIPDVFAWTGFASSFRNAGFEEVARRSPTRPLMRRVVSNSCLG
jgi:GNAT superfamily N-acetyltransferase